MHHRKSAGCLGIIKGSTLTGELAVMVRQGRRSQEEAAALQEEDTRQCQEPDPAVVKQFMEKYGVPGQQLRLAKPE